MNATMKRFEKPDERRTFERGTFDVVRLGGMTLGRATYEPGWRWSLHVGPGERYARCQVEHVGVVLSGRAAVEMDDGTLIEMGAGDIFHIGVGHDSWVLGDESYVSLHLLGADAYTR